MDFYFNSVIWHRDLNHKEVNFILHHFIYCINNSANHKPPPLFLNIWGKLFFLQSSTRLLHKHLREKKPPDCWIKRDQLDVTCFIISLFTAQHVSDVNTSILRSLRLICWVISWVVLIWFDVCWCYVVVWLGWCGIRMQAEALVLGVVSVCRLKHCFSLHTDTTPPQQNHTVTPTHIEPEQYNPWNNSTNKSQVPEDGCINIRNVLSIK